jgi:hypothetical protein
MVYKGVRFEEFAAAYGVRLRAGLVAAYGPEVGVEAASDALAYGWEHWDRIGATRNPAGYLFRVGQSAARRYRRQPVLFPGVEVVESAPIDPISFQRSRPSANRSGPVWCWCTRWDGLRRIPPVCWTWIRPPSGPILIERRSGSVPHWRWRAMPVKDVESELRRLGDWLEDVSAGPLRPDVIAGSPVGRRPFWRRRGSVAGVIVAVSVGVGGLAAAAWTSVARSDEFLDGVPGGSPAQDAALADGAVTLTEYHEAMTRFEACVAETGHELEGVAFDPNTQLYSYLVPAAAGEGCYNSEFFAIDMVWQLREDRVALMPTIDDARDVCGSDHPSSKLDSLADEQLTSLCAYVNNIDQD